MGCFLKCLEMCPFSWRRFCRCAINRLGHAFPQTQNIFTNGTLIPKIYSACSFADAMFSSGNFQESFFYFMSFAHAQSTSESKSAYFCLSCMRTMSKRGFVKFRHKSFSYSLEKSEMCLLFFHKWEESGTFERLSVALLILMIFLNKYGTAAKVGMYVHRINHGLMKATLLVPKRLHGK